MFRNKSIFITGATGSFGQAFVSHLIKNHSNFKRLVVFSRDELKQFEMTKLEKLICIRKPAQPGDLSILPFQLSFGRIREKPEPLQPGNAGGQSGVVLLSIYGPLVVRVSSCILSFQVQSFFVITLCCAVRCGREFAIWHAHISFSLVLCIVSLCTGAVAT